MKILLISEFFPTGKDLRFSGGVETRTFFLAKNLAKKHKVYVLTSRLPNASTKETMFGFSVFRVGPARKYNPTVGSVLDRMRFVKAAIDFGKSQNIDLVDGSNFISHFIAKNISRAKKIPAVAWYPDVWIGSWFKNAGLFGIFGEILERLNLMLGFDSYIAISHQTARKLQNYIKKKVNIIPCGIDNQEFRASVKKFHNPTIICVSRLAKYKNVKTLILAFANLTLKIPDLKLIIVGEGPQETELRNLANALKISSKIQFLSNLPRKKLTNLLCSAHVFCLTSGVEGFGIAVIEAAAAGLPYVVSDIEVLKEVTKNGQGGLIFKLGDIEDLSSKLQTLFTDNKLYETKSREALKLAHDYQWSKVSDKTLHLYSKLI